MSIPFWDPAAAWVDAPAPDSLVPDVNQPYPDGLSQWDTIYFAGQRAPGTARVTFRRMHRTDTAHAPGSDGGSTNSLGIEDAEINIQILLWTANQLADFVSLIPVIHRRPTKAGKFPSVQVGYPALGMWGISKLFVLEIAGPQPTSQAGVFEVTLRCAEHAPPTSIPVGPVAPSPSTIPNASAQATPSPTPSPSQGSPAVLP